MKHKILLVEDEIKTAITLQKGLEEFHYEVNIANNGVEGIEKARNKTYNLIITDIMMPVMNGIDFCSLLRKEEISTPVLMLTALGTIDDKTIGFESGADDYLVKPFEFKELLLRVKALLKRSPIILEQKNSLRFSDLELDLETKSVYREGKTIELTAREFALMEYFLLNPERVISKSEIAEKVWDINFDMGTNVIEVYVNYLRNKVDKNFNKKLIHTAHGMGYILKEK
jgi:two-component system copper resistance phosphate regulon response regulator CusR